MIHPTCATGSERSETERHKRLNLSIMHSGGMIQWGHVNEASLSCHIWEQVCRCRSSCTAASGAYIRHVKRAGVVYNLSLFNISCTRAGEWIPESAGGPFFSESRLQTSRRGAPHHQVRYGLWGCAWFPTY